jgi:hypothetical protein
VNKVDPGDESEDLLVAEFERLERIVAARDRQQECATRGHQLDTLQNRWPPMDGYPRWICSRCKESRSADEYANMSLSAYSIYSIP